MSAIIELDREGQVDGSIERILGAGAIQMLLRQTFRPRLVRASGTRESHFTQILRIACQVPCFRFVNGHRLAPRDLAEYLETWVG